MAVVMASGGDGLRSVRRTEEGGRVFRGEDEDAREREKGEGVRGIRSGVGVAAGRQEVALRVRARRGHTPLSYCPEEEDDREGAGGLGRPAAVLGQMGR